MIDAETVSRINLAVDSCLEYCHNSDLPPVRAVARFCVDLRSKGWDATEIDLVNSIVSRVIQWDDRVSPTR